MKFFLNKKNKNRGGKFGEGFTPLIENGMAQRVKATNIGLAKFFQFHSKKSEKSKRSKTMPFFTTGFTLIEIMVTIAIFGIMTAIVIVGINETRRFSRDNKRVADIKNIQLALEQYFNAHRYYPTTLPELVSKGFLSSEMPIDPVSKLPLDPNGVPYKYAGITTYSGGCASFHLGATLEGSSSYLGEDKDGNGAGALCTGSDPDFSGADPVFDVMPSF